MGRAKQLLDGDRPTAIYRPLLPSGTHRVESPLLAEQRRGRGQTVGALRCIGSTKQKGRTLRYSLFARTRNARNAITACVHRKSHFFALFRGSQITEIFEEIPRHRHRVPGLTQQGIQAILTPPTERY